MKKIVSIVTPVVIAGLLTACSPETKNQDVGTLAGGVAGGLLGAQVGGGNGQIVAAVGGALLGAFLGNKIGASMDKQDQAEVNKTLESSRTNQTTSWTNPDTHNSYAVTPTKTFYQNKQPCRDYVMNVTLDNGETKKVHGTACRGSDGEWRVKN